MFPAEISENSWVRDVCPSLPRSSTRLAFCSPLNVQCGTRSTGPIFCHIRTGRLDSGYGKLVLLNFAMLHVHHQIRRFEFVQNLLRN